MISDVDNNDVEHRLPTQLHLGMILNLWQQVVVVLLLFMFIIMWSSIIITTNRCHELVVRQRVMCPTDGWTQTHKCVFFEATSSGGRLSFLAGHTNHDHIKKTTTQLKPRVTSRQDA